MLKLFFRKIFHHVFFTIRLYLNFYGKRTEKLLEKNNFSRQGRWGCMNQKIRIAIRRHFESTVVWGSLSRESLPLLVRSGMSNAGEENIMAFRIVNSPTAETGQFQTRLNA